MRQSIQSEKSLWKNSAPDVANRERLVSMLGSGGAFAASSVDARVVKLLERVGIFLANGVIVDAHAFALYGNMLGLRWDSETTRTQDIDVATERHVVIGIANR